MWLPKDERRLLAAYYVTIGEMEKEVRLAENDLIKVLNASRFRWKELAQKLEHDADPDSLPIVDEHVNKLMEKDNGQTYKDLFGRLQAANRALVKRRLIECQHVDDLGFMLSVSLNVEGYDWGRKYSRWLTSSGLWFEEYRNHWIAYLIGLLAGVLTSLLIN